jgi:hypothetical protein
MSAQQTLTREVIDRRYVDLRDQNLAAAPTREDREELVGLDPPCGSSARAAGARQTTGATRQLTRACWASLAAAAESRTASSGF